jgi:hypothetical protein
MNSVAEILIKEAMALDSTIHSSKCILMSSKLLTLPFDL